MVGVGAPGKDGQHLLPMSYSPDYGGIFLWGAWAPSFEAPPPGYLYHSGTVFRNWNGLAQLSGFAQVTHLSTAT